MALDEQKLHAFLGRALVDLGGTVNTVLMTMGDRLGLYQALAAERHTPETLARATGTHPRYVREWLQLPGGRRLCRATTPAAERYYLSEEQALCLANPNGPVDLPGAAALSEDFFYVRDRAIENFRTGKGMEWGEHHPCLFHGTERFFRAGYNANLLDVVDSGAGRGRAEARGGRARRRRGLRPRRERRS